MSKRKPSRSTLPTRPPRLVVLLHQVHAVAAGGQQRGGGQPGDAAADDDHATGAGVGEWERRSEAVGEADLMNVLQ